MLLLVTLVMAGCSAAAGTSLDGRAFLSTAVTIDGQPHSLVPGTRIRISFADGSLSAAAGCNIYGATYQVQDGRLLASGGAMTEMACDEARMAQDDWLFGFIGARPEIIVTADTLTLAAAGTRITLLDREVADPDLPLIGPTWTVDSIISGDAVSSIPEHVVAVLIFQADGRVAIETGCNSGGGRFAATADALGFSELALTKRACEGAAAEMEAAVLRVLRAETVGYRIEAGSLTLSAGGFGLGLTAR